MTTPDTPPAQEPAGEPVLPPTRVLVVDDQALFRQAIARLLDLQPDFEVVGESENGAEAIEATGELEPDLVLMDVEMPVLGGVEAARRIRERHRLVKIVMLTISDDDEFLIDAVRSGVDGYLLKDMTPDALFDGLRTVLAGQSSISPAMVSRLFREVREGGDVGGAAAPFNSAPFSPPPFSAAPFSPAPFSAGAGADRAGTLPPRGAFGGDSSAAALGRAPATGTANPASPAHRDLLMGDPPLSFRELETMRLVATGMTNKEIGQELSITEGTVKNHVHSALTKLGMENRIQAAAHILRHGL